MGRETCMRVWVEHQLIIVGLSGVWFVRTAAAASGLHFAQC